MGTRIHIGNLSLNATSADLENLFSDHGTVRRAEVVVSPTTGRSKGFGFVEMSTDVETRAAIVAMHGVELDNRAITVNEAPAGEAPRAVVVQPRGPVPVPAVPTALPVPGLRRADRRKGHVS